MRGSWSGERRSLSLSYFFFPFFFSLNGMIYYYYYFNFIYLFAYFAIVDQLFRSKKSYPKGQCRP